MSLRSTSRETCALPHRSDQVFRLHAQGPAEERKGLTAPLERSRADREFNGACWREDREMGLTTVGVYSGTLRLNAFMIAGVFQEALRDAS